MSPADRRTEIAAKTRQPASNAAEHLLKKYKSQKPVTNKDLGGVQDPNDSYLDESKPGQSDSEGKPKLIRETPEFEENPPL